jgi:hypothetical protein
MLPMLKPKMKGSSANYSVLSKRSCAENLRLDHPRKISSVSGKGGNEGRHNGAFILVVDTLSANQARRLAVHFCAVARIQP